MNTAIKYYDFSIVCGHRGKLEQMIAFQEGKSTKPWPESKHNKLPSLAIDIAPYPIDWEDKGRFHFLAGLIKGLSFVLNIPIRWGGDWDSDGDLSDQKLQDLPHFELLT